MQEPCTVALTQQKAILEIDADPPRSLAGYERRRQVINLLMEIKGLDRESCNPLTAAHVDAYALQLAPIVYTMRSIIVHRAAISTPLAKPCLHRA
jgi:hypothetical protein